jgi:hypothetical protein
MKNVEMGTPVTQGLTRNPPLSFRGLRLGGRNDGGVLNRYVKITKNRENTYKNSQKYSPNY